MPQHEKTVQPSAEEAAQTEPFQKTKDLAKPKTDQLVENEAAANPSLQNQPGATAPTPPAPGGDEPGEEVTQPDAPAPEPQAEPGK